MSRGAAIVAESWNRYRVSNLRPGRIGVSFAVIPPPPDDRSSRREAAMRGGRDAVRDYSRSPPSPCVAWPNALRISSSTAGSSSRTRCSGTRSVRIPNSANCSSRARS